MSEMSSNIILVILVTSFATYLSRFLGVVSSEKIDETSKIFKWFNCIAYSILAALIARIVVFPSGTLQEADLWLRLFVVIICIVVYLLSKKNLVYPTVLSAILLALLNNYL
jgi:branched-subunit amino acid transport protein